MLYYRHQLGKQSELEAERWFLQQSGYCLLAKNYRCRWGEIDLIFEHELSHRAVELVFVEVRARVRNVWVSAPESVDWKKQKRLKKTAEYFISQYQGLAQSMRLDLLFWNGSVWSHMPNLWLI